MNSGFVFFQNHQLVIKLPIGDFEKHQSPIQNDGGDCRTAPATTGLFNIGEIIQKYHNIYFSNNLNAKLTFTTIVLVLLLIYILF